HHSGNRDDDRRDGTSRRRQTPSPSDKYDGFPAFSSRIKKIQLPQKFKTTGIEKFTGKQDPEQWLRVYSTAITMAGGSNDVKVIY
ncbi:hypothetical protein, partial [Flavobacterium sp. SaA2.13]|uniref:hypothetical protein n=1 Tax=Flavobacterium sp. SaA2.13 TaxID=2691898 RepID=UPI001CEFA448